MKRIGILGGVSAQSTVSYYLTITQEHIKRHNNMAYPEIIIHSVLFQDYLDWQNAGRWDITSDHIVEVFSALARAGAEVGLIATNTLHRVFDEVTTRSPVPLISIIDTTAQAIRAAGLSTVGLLGTQFTMEEDFYARGLARAGITTIVPQSVEERAQVHQIIIEKLVRGIIDEESRVTVVAIAKRLLDRGAEAVILGCTELPLLIGKDDLSEPLFDTARIHALAALDASEEER